MAGFENLFTDPMAAIGYGLLTSRENPLGAGVQLLQQAAQSKQDNDYKNALLQYKMKSAAVESTPSAVREYEYYNGLTPDERKSFLNVKRAQQALNLGGSYAILGVDGSINNQIPKTLPPEKTPSAIEDAATAKVVGEDNANAVINLPKLESQATGMIRKIDEMIGNEAAGIPRHAGFESAVGAKDWTSLYGLRSQPFDGTDAADFVSRLDEVKGGQFLQAFEVLKGAGAIANAEGEKATQAISRMKAAQSEPEFIKAAQDFRSVVVAGLERARKKAQGVNAAPQPAQTQPPVDGSISKTPSGRTYRILP